MPVHALPWRSVSAAHHCARAQGYGSGPDRANCPRKFVWLLSNYDVDFVPTFCYISHIPLTSGVSGDVPKAGGKSKARAQKRAAGTKKTALFDIVNREWRERRTANGSVDAIA
jgi:hypothetical protein